MGIESHNADFFVITQTTPEQVFYSAPGRSREISRKVDRDVFHRGLLLTILTAPITQSPSGLFTVSKLYQNPSLIWPLEDAELAKADSPSC
jgi:hypothetical protein